MSYYTDRKIEQQIAAWMDRYFYSRLKCSSDRIPSDDPRQMHGVDVVLDGKICIDEKAKYRSNMLNQTINSIGFEISRYCRDGQLRHGWYVDPSELTTHYSTLSIYADCNIPEDITTDNIYKIVALTVSKKQLKSLTSRIWTDRELLEQSQMMRDTQTPRLNSTNPDIWMTLTPPSKFLESPCNLVIRRKILKSLPGSAEFEITRGGIKQI